VITEGGRLGGSSGFSDCGYVVLTEVDMAKIDLDKASSSA
jgi:hypothetical protein